MEISLALVCVEVPPETVDLPSHSTLLRRAAPVGGQRVIGAVAELMVEEGAPSLHRLHSKTLGALWHARVVHAPLTQLQLAVLRRGEGLGGCEGKVNPPFGTCLEVWEVWRVCY